MTPPLHRGRDFRNRLIRVACPAMVHGAIDVFATKDRVAERQDRVAYRRARQVDVLP
jgi:hypothetical protein